MTTAADQFRESLRDESRWVIRRAVPIFSAHERTVKRDGKEKTITVTESDLDAIANAMQKAEAETGTLAVITPGHVEPMIPEDVQPPTYGFVRNPRVGTFGPSAKKCVLADEWYYPKHADDARSYPYRSSYYFPHDRRIMSVALLKNRPALDLGTIGEGYAYSMEQGMDPATATAPQPAAPQPIAPEEQALFDKAIAYMVTNPAFLAGIKSAMTPATPAVDPATPPAVDPETPAPDAPEAKDDDEEDKDVEDAKYSALETRIKEVEAERDRERCERIVSELEGLGYSLDRDYEVGQMVKYSADERTKYVANLKTRYTKVPGKGGGIPVDSTKPTPIAGGESRAMTKDEMQAALAYAEEKGWTGPSGFLKARKLWEQGKMI